MSIKLWISVLLQGDGGTELNAGTIQLGRQRLNLGGIHYHSLPILARVVFSGAYNNVRFCAVSLPVQAIGERRRPGTA